MKNMSIRETAEKALDIMQAHSVGADMDAGFDAGEFSGPAHSRMEQREIEELAKANGFTFDQVEDELLKLEHEGDELGDWYGRNL